MVVDRNPIARSPTDPEVDAGLGGDPDGVLAPSHRHRPPAGREESPRSTQGGKSRSRLGVEKDLVNS